MDGTELRPPTLEDPDGTGLVLDVVSIGVHNPLPLPHEDSYLYVICGDGTRHRLPGELRAWATETLVEHQHRLATDLVPLLPMTVEVGIRDGRMVARPLPNPAGPSRSGAQRARRASMS